MKRFDHCYVINRDVDTERLKGITEQCNKIGLPFERFSATDGDIDVVEWKPNDSLPGWNINAAALLDTTIRLMRYAKKKGYKHILILEDDIMFSERIETYMADLQFPEDAAWDLFHFGCIHKLFPVQVGKNLVRLQQSDSCTAYAIHSRIYDDYIELLEHRDMPIDCYTSMYFHPHRRSFATKDNMIFHKPNYSTIRKKNINYKIK